MHKNILDILNNSEASIQNKLDVIDFYLKDSNFSTNSNNRVAGFELTAGDLFRDFNPLENITEVF
jgi:hypothetical protein